jgi:hypothetical protein
MRQDNAVDDKLNCYLKVPETLSKLVDQHYASTSLRKEFAFFRRQALQLRRPVLDALDKIKEASASGKDGRRLLLSARFD